MAAANEKQDYHTNVLTAGNDDKNSRRNGLWDVSDSPQGVKCDKLDRNQSPGYG